ncbi:ATP-dependent Clp protease proteolytic subunit [Streptomyces lancefieldiae]|uniref:ATP-dependent Clp protease proteolytic subunit n=1 Tax=Streptomyces lancefieldiae TaxID=3075520 RepID=A0ABU3ALX2_9ACTN|nr:ATP-dependent Clp protease proteolytic subunit [Streptomyces sp. DSM 40712]MDT0610938.1 ATP-dependent Clp protease proteolytic subunit [Streptomyces sp. DSM 40712]
MTPSQPPFTGPKEGKASDPALHADAFAHIRARLERIPVRHTGRTPERVNTDIERAANLDAHQAPEHGPVDRTAPGRRATLPTSGVEVSRRRCHRNRRRCPPRPARRPT